MEILTGQKVWLVKSKLGEAQGVIGVFNNSFAAEKYAEEKYRKWTDDEKFTWNRGKTAQEINIKISTQPQSLKGNLIISEYLVRSR